MKKIILIIAVIVLGFTFANAWATVQTSEVAMPKAGAAFKAPKIDQASSNADLPFMPAANMPAGYYVVTQDIPLYDVPGGYQGYGNQILLSTNDQGGVAYLHAGDIIQITGEWAGGSEAISRIQIPGQSGGPLDGDRPIIAGSSDSALFNTEILTISVISSSEGVTGTRLVTDITGGLLQRNLDSVFNPVMTQEGAATTMTVGEGGAQVYTLHDGFFVNSATVANNIPTAAAGSQIIVYGDPVSTGLFGLGGQYSYVGNGLWVKASDIH
ncbi:MAG: hypothetical protein V2A59_01675 [Candidatus Omnitrophota bacterium]